MLCNLRKKIGVCEFMGLIITELLVNCTGTWWPKLGKYLGNERLVIHVAAARKLLGKRDKYILFLAELQQVQ